MSIELIAPARAFVGRERELRLLTGLARSGRTGGAAAVVYGEAGIGKTTLLRRVAEQEAGNRVLWAQGSEAEVGLPYATLADLMMPLRTQFAQLPEVQREALEISLALRGGPPVGPLAVCAAALGVLAAAGEQQPLLVLIDDFHWVDPASQQVLLFVARRLDSAPVVLLCAVCDQPPRAEEPLALPGVHLRGLDPVQSRELVAAHGIEVCDHVLDRLVRRSGGNPLALLESLAQMPVESRCRAGRADVTLGASLHRAWSRALAGFPEATRTALYVLAACRSDTACRIEPVLQALGCSLADLALPEDSGLVQVRDGVLELVHPLLRSAVAARTPLGVRVRVHRAFADHCEGPRRAWHLASAATGPDEPVAQELVGAADVARDRGAYRAAARALGRAATLTPDPEVRAERLLAAATDAHAAGQAELVHACCEQALALRPGPQLTAEIELVRGRALRWLGHPARAADELLRAAEAVPPPDRRRAAALYVEAALPALLANRIPLMLDAARRAEQLSTATGTVGLPALAVAAAAHVLAGRGAEGRERLAAAQPLVAGADPERDVEHLVLLARVRTWVEDREGARQALDAIVDHARRGASWALADALTARAELGWWSGQWAAAEADVTEALRWADELGQVGAVALAVIVHARLDACRGDLAACRLRLSRVVGDSGPYGIGATAVHRPAVLGLAALGVGELTEAVELLELAWNAAVTGSLAAPTAVPFAGDLVEAHIRAGNTARAAEALSWLDELSTDGGPAFPAAVAARCRGLLAADAGTAEWHFAEATRRHRRQVEPFELARSQLCAGEALRRLRRPAAARPLLREAVNTFDTLGARPWADRAACELAATGQHRAPRPEAEPGNLDALTPQELQIARVVADGLNNVEAGAVLYLSRKTVEAHLTRVYRKLGLRSRTDLARVLGSGRGEPVALRGDHDRMVEA